MEANYSNSYTECSKMFKNGGFLFLRARDKPGHSCTSCAQEYRSGFKNPHIFVIQAFQRFVHEVQKRGLHSALSGCGSPAHPYLKIYHTSFHGQQSSEDTAGPGMNTDLQPRAKPCDSDCLAPQRGQDVEEAAWMQRALPSSYQRLLPVGLGESFRFAKAKSN